MTPGQLALAEAARAEAARVYGTTCPEPAREQHTIVETPFSRPVESYYGPAPASDLVALVGAIVPARSPGRPRIPVEQAIARGLGDEQISAVLDVDTGYVASVRARLDRAAS